MKPLSITGSWLVTPEIHQDPRGKFLQLYDSGRFTEAVRHPLDLRQASISVSAKGVVRGIHYSMPGQGKYISCLHGSIIDVIVDIRIGSPTFGKVNMVALDDTQHQAIYLSPDLGHGFCAMTKYATVLYLQSVAYDPAAERSLDPMDLALGIHWPTNAPQLSQRDLSAPGLAQLQEQGLLPTYQEPA